MKKALTALLIMGSAITAHSYWETVEVYESSYTATNEGPRVIPNTPPGTIFVGAVVGTTTTGGMLRVYNSSGVASSQIANISLGTVMGYAYNIRVSSGITYTTSGNSNGVTLIFKRVK